MTGYFGDAFREYEKKCQQSESLDDLKPFLDTLSKENVLKSYDDLLKKLEEVLEKRGNESAIAELQSMQSPYHL